MPSENLNRYKQPLTCWANWIFGGAADEIDNSTEAGLIDLV